MAIQMYVQDNNELLPAAGGTGETTSWLTATALSPKVYQCPDAPSSATYSYLYNGWLDGQPMQVVPDATTMLMTVDGLQHTQNGAVVGDAPNAICYPSEANLTHNNGWIESFVDGHVAFYATGAVNIGPLNPISGAAYSLPMDGTATKAAGALATPTLLASDSDFNGYPAYQCRNGAGISAYQFSDMKNPFTIVMVMKPVKSGTYNSGDIIFDTGGNEYMGFTAQWGTPANFCISSNGGDFNAVLVGTTAVLATHPHAWIITSSGGTMNIYQDNTAAAVTTSAVGTASSVPNAPLTLSYDNGLSGRWTPDDWAEFDVYTSALTPAQVAAEQTFLQLKYGI